MTRRAKVTAAAVVAVVALLVSGAVWLTGDSRTAGQPASIPHAPAVESKCGLVGTPGMPTALPATWENVGGFSLPISSTDGPGRRSPTGAWSCFAHTPSGAVLAGAVISMRAAGLAEDWKAVVREQTMPGPGQATLLASTPTQPTNIPSLKGFSIAAYSDARATINYYLPTDVGAFSCTTDVVWYQGDWRLQLGADGSTATGCTQGVPTSFVPWGPS